ncbi:MAG: anion permease [Candidatus Melainabacteria bacterium]
MDSGTGFLLLIVIVILALLFDYINGFHDAANAIATVVSTRVMTPRTAVIFGAVLNGAGAFMGTEVAATIGKGLVHAEAITMPMVLVALLGAILWNILTWYLGLPTSSSHALIGSLLGATFFATSTGWRNIEWLNLWQMVIIPMFTSPLAGFAIGFLIMGILLWIFHRMHLFWINQIFGKLQIVSSGIMALSHGHNDAQKSMGIIALALFTMYPSSHFEVPLWVILSCGVMMALGTLTGGWKIIRTMGQKMSKIQPIHGFAAETAAAGIIMGASQYGIPLSTTHVITTSIMGVAATKRLSAVKWGVVGSILWAWVLTIPITFLFSGALAWLLLRSGIL